MRGVRQVGKSTTIRKFGQKFEHYIELNFEENQDVHLFFQGNLNVEEICNKLAVYTRIPILPGKTLLFFDEIQRCIPAITSLRYFYEQIPELHVIAAGSLLEFALSELPSFGVGRVRSLHNRKYRIGKLI